MKHNLTIANLTDGPVALTYGPGEETRLVLTVTEEWGEHREISFEAAAVSQFARMFRELDKRFPGAFRGH
jgi:hypothetical protein